MENNTNKNILQDPTICIIGAGVSGLACANKLKESGLNNIIILEASDKLGGRVRKYPKENKFADIDLDLGGEEVHGKETYYYDIVSKNEGKLFYYWKINKFYLGYRNEINTIDEIINKSENADLNYVWNLFEDMSIYLKEDYPDMCLTDFLKIKNVSQDSFFLANAMMGVESGSDLDHISVKGYNEYYKNFRAGGENFFLTNMSHYDILAKAFNKILLNINFNSQVTRINYSDNQKILVSDKNDVTYECDFCVITVPVSQIPKINFTPNLPENFTNALNTLKLDSCAKVILKFKKSFWPKDSSWILIPGLINVYWSATQGKDSMCHLLTGMTSGENCRILNKLYKKDKKEFIDIILTDLSKGFNLKKNELFELFEDFVWFDWSDVEFIEGGYTYAMVNEGDCRSVLRTFVNNRLLFAGEATASFGYFGTINGAIESGLRAADQVIQKLN
jgi:polyamine oxidase